MLLLKGVPGRDSRELVPVRGEAEEEMNVIAWIKYSLF
jgi:hypothetical protein